MCAIMQSVYTRYATSMPKCMHRVQPGRWYAYAYATSSCQQGKGTYLRIGGGGPDGHAQKLVDAGAGGEGASDLDVGDEHLDTAEQGM